MFERWGCYSGSCKYFTTIFGYQKSVFELSWSLPILSYTGPLIIPGNIIPNSCINHGLDGKNVTSSHKSDCLIVFIVRNLRCLMEHCSNTMPSIWSNNWKPKWLNMICNNISTFPVHVSWLTILNCLHKAVISCFNKGSWALSNLTNAICLIHICMITIFVTTDI